MPRYETIVDTIMKLQNCLKLQKVLSRELVSKLDLLTKPRVGISLAIAIWANKNLKRGFITYGDLLYVQRRIALFLSRASNIEKRTLEKLFALLPIRYGQDIDVLSRRCIIDHQLLLEFVRAINILQEAYSMIRCGETIEEPLKRDRRLCLDDPDLLPPAHANSDIYIELIVKALNDTPELQEDAVASHIVEVINDKLVRGQIMPPDISAIALLALALAKQLDKTIVCAEPCINIEALARRVYSDLSALGVEPSESDIYSLYRDLLVKSVLRK